MVLPDLSGAAMISRLLKAKLRQERMWRRDKGGNRYTGYLIAGDVNVGSSPKMFQGFGEQFGFGRE